MNLIRFLLRLIRWRENPSPYMIHDPVLAQLAESNADALRALDLAQRARRAAEDGDEEEAYRLAAESLKAMDLAFLERDMAAMGTKGDA